MDPSTIQEINNEQQPVLDEDVTEDVKEVDEEPVTEPTAPARTTGNFNYCCPSCGGMFASWDHDIPNVATSADDTAPKQCPFCHTTAGEFGEESDLAEENEQLRSELDAAEEQIVQLQEALEEVQGAIE